MERIEQSGFDLCLRQRLVAMWRKQAMACCKDGALAVAFYAASFEYEVEMVFVVSFEDVLLCHSSANAVVKIGGKLLSPAVELEVEQTGAVGRKECDEAMVASPSVVGGCFAERYALHAFVGKVVCEEMLYFFGIGCDDDEAFA